MGVRKVSPKQPDAGYRGKQTKVGNSLGLRFDKALFQSHPEFSGEVRAHVIAPGKLLVVAQPGKSRREADPVMDAFLSFLAADMARNPGQIRELDAGFVNDIRDLVDGIAVDPGEDLDDEPIV